jgi:hypothetical protein
MKLQQGDEREFLDAQCGLKAQTILLDVFLGVPLRKTEVEYALAIKRADAAWAGTEAMYKPRELQERGYLQYSDAIRRPGSPARLAI